MSKAKVIEPKLVAPPADKAGASKGIPAWRRVLADMLAGNRYTLVVPLILAVVLLTFPLWGGHDEYWLRELSLIAVLALVVSGVNLSFGYAGEVQFGQVFMYALGAYVASAIAVKGYAELIPLLILGGLVAAAVGLLVALPAVRIGGWSLAMASFFLVLVIPSLLNLTEKYSGGALGLVGIPPANLFGKPMGTEAMYMASVICLILWLACLRNLVTSRYGVIFRVLRESQVLTGSLGFSPHRLKALAYSLGALPAGVAGALFGFLSQVLSPSSFGLEMAIGIIAASVLSGVEAIYAVVIGAAILQLGPEKSLDFAQYAAIVYGLFLIVAAVMLKRGISGIGKRQALKLSRRLVPVEHASQDIAVKDAAKAPMLKRVVGAALSIEAVSKSFGGVKAVREVTLTAEPGVVTALIGSNGSGKTTLLNVICGYNTCDAGSVQFDGEPLTGAPFQIARRGVGRTFQTPSVPRGVSVRDVVASGRFMADRTGPFASMFRLPKFHRSRKADREHAEALLQLVGLADIADEEAQELSLGTRRLVEVARALCAEPRLLLLDEPASGLSEEEVDRLGAVIRAAADAGATVILIEHNFRFVTRIADIAHVLHLGELIASGPAATIGDNPAVIESYLGATTEGVKPVGAVAATNGAAKVERPVVLELRDAVAGYGDLTVLHGISLILREGAVEVILGRNGVGKTTTLAAISGQIPLWEGQLELEGQRVTKQASFRRASKGVALVQEGKRIFRHRTVRENLMLGTYTQRLSRAERNAICEEVMGRFPILNERADQLAGGLSGGQQQMLAIGQALASRPRVLLLDEPSAGLAPTIIAEVFAQVRQLRSEGMTILLVEQLAEQALAVADHVTVIDSGQIVKSGPPELFHDRRELQEAYFGASVAK
jgi:branched-chain amino acid transport system permease protein